MFTCDMPTTVCAFEENTISKKKTSFSSSRVCRRQQKLCLYNNLSVYKIHTESRLTGSKRGHLLPVVAAIFWILSIIFFFRHKLIFQSVILNFKNRIIFLDYFMKYIYNDDRNETQFQTNWAVWYLIIVNIYSAL